MMTESEAKTKWCPFARMLAHTYAQDGKGRIFEGGYSYNRSPDDDECYIPTGAKCIASGCMAWRWEHGAVFDGDRGFMVHDMGPHGVGHARGYCGLAGARP